MTPCMPPPETAALRAALERLLVEKNLSGLPIVALDRRPSAYRTSFPLEEICVVLSDGAELEIIFKDLNRRLLSETVRRAKPEFVYDPLREIETYRRFLAEVRLGTAHCWGAIVDKEIGRYWLFIEKVAGDELYKIGEFATWEQTARWLAGMHKGFERFAPAATRSAHWLNYVGDYFRRWMRRAQEMMARSADRQSQSSRRVFARLAENYEQVVGRLAALPVTFIHGEFYASNVLIGRTASGLRVCPIDWEMAGAGAGLLDLAALIAGRWTDSERLALAHAYHGALAEAGEPALPQEELFLKAIDDCRLHLAVQWLGWSQEWVPPPEHAQDWLGEALALA